MWMADSMKPSSLTSGMGAEMEQQPMLGMQTLPWDERPVLSGSFPHTLSEPGGCHLYVAWLTCGQEGLGQAWD